MAKVQKSTDSSSLSEVVDRILDKGIVIDALGEGVAGRHRAAVDRGPRGHRQRRDVPEVRRGDWLDRQRRDACVVAVIPRPLVCREIGGGCDSQPATWGTRRRRRSL